MRNCSTLKYVLLIAVLAAALPEVTLCLGKDWSGRQPANKPVRESEEKEEASGTSEFEDGDDSVAFGVVADGEGWKCNTWAARELATNLFRRVHQHGPDHCRAPPAPLV